MKNSKLKGSKKIAYLLSGAGAIALTGIAFSAWIITRDPVPVDVSPISVTVGDVEDHSVTIKNHQAVDRYDELSFDASSGDTTGPIVAGDDSKEQLQFKVEFDVSGALSSENAFTSWYGGFKVALSVVTDDSTVGSSSSINAAGEALNSAISSNYLSMPITGEVTFTPDTTAPDHVDGNGGDGLTAVCTTKESSGSYDLHVVLTFAFKWGSAFGSSNPGFTTATDDSTLSSIKAALTALKKASGAHLNVTLTPQIKKA